MTLDQIRSMAREANPIPDPDTLDEIVAPALPESIRSGAMSTTQTKPTESGSQEPRSPIWAIAATVIAILAVGAIALFMANPGEVDVAGEEATGVEAVTAWAAAMSSGDVEGALETLDPAEASDMTAIISFWAATGVQMTAENCSTSSVGGTTLVECRLSMRDPILSATSSTFVPTSFEHGETGLLIKEFGDLSAPGSAFVQYASAYESEDYDRVCNPQTAHGESDGFLTGIVSTAECGRLWAQLAPAVAVWIENGRPDPGPDPEAALAAVHAWAEALTNGDAETAVSLLHPDEREPAMVDIIEFLASYGVTSTAEDCAATVENETVVVDCILVDDGPIMRALDLTHLPGTLVYTGEGLRIRDLGNRIEALQAFSRYAGLYETEAFDEVCNPLTAEGGSWVASGHVQTGACGKLYAQLAPAVAAWIEADRPDPTD